MLTPRGKIVAEFVAANIKRLRARAHLSQEQLAEAADLGMRFVQQIEAAKTNIGLNALVAIADALGAPPAALLKRAKFVQAPVGRPSSKNKKIR